MLHGVVSAARKWLQELNRMLVRPHPPVAPGRPSAVAPPQPLQSLEGVRLTDGVARTLFEEFAAHRAASRGEEETGWVLLGLREAHQAVVLATLPAGAQRDASISHVRFNSMAQAVASRIVRQADRRLTILGVVHTHPGSLRHPSDGDYQGDRQWVRHLRGGAGIFGIGTADGTTRQGTLFAEQPLSNVQTWGGLRLSWYALGVDDSRYRPLPVVLTMGPDLARPLHAVWITLEAHAERLERLYRQQAGVSLAVANDAHRGPGLVVQVPLAEPDTAVRAFVTEKEVTYDLVHDGQVLAVNPGECRVDRGIYLLLAELAAQE